MIKRTFPLLISYLIVFNFLIVSSGDCGGFRLVDQSAQASAKGNAFVATADDPSAVHYNPAGITQLEGTQFLSGTFITSLDVDHKRPDGGSSSTTNKVAGPPQVYATTELGESDFSFGLGINSTFGQGVEWPQDISEFRTGVIEVFLLYLTLSPVIAWEVNDELSIGGGIDFNYGDLFLTSGLDPEGIDDRLEFDYNGFGTGFRFGVLWQPEKEHSFGASYHSASMSV